MVSLGDGFFSAGGTLKHMKLLDDRTIIVNNLGAKENGPKLDQAKRGACAAVIKEEGSIKTIAVLGGQTSLQQDQQDSIRDMEIFICNTKPNPQCEKKQNGPKMQTSHLFFGCGVIQAQNGRRILLAVRDWNISSVTEALELDNDSAQWQLCKK